MTSRAYQRPSYRIEGSDRVHTTVPRDHADGSSPIAQMIGRLRRDGGITIDVAVLSSATLPPILSIRGKRADGTIFSRTEFRLEELATLEAAIAATRAAARKEGT